MSVPGRKHEQVQSVWETDQTAAAVVLRFEIRCKLGFVINSNVMALSIYTMGQTRVIDRGKSGKL